MEFSEQIVGIITAGTVQVTPHADLLKKLSLGRPLRIKLGADPTAPNLHLGHAVVLSKLKEFQDLGHEILFIIGDFTARIGDPTGKSATRPPLTDEAIEHNMQTYFQQVGKILDVSKIKIKCNGEWLNRLSSIDMVRLCSKVTLARITEREDFQTRIAEQKPIGFHELLYPLFQAYDSVELNADVELGGTDQTFNLLMGRFLQEQMGQEAQVIITIPLLEGLDGVNKMSKSLGNDIGIAEPADQAYGKLMSISDDLMWRYAFLLLRISDAELANLKQQVAQETVHPMVLKKRLAQDIIAKFWSPAEAEHAARAFESAFQKKDYSNLPLTRLDASVEHTVWIIDLLRILGAVESSSEARRLMQAGAVHVNDEVVTDFKAMITWQNGTIVKVGKHRLYKLSR